MKREVQARSRDSSISPITARLTSKRYGKCYHCTTVIYRPRLQNLQMYLESCTHYRKANGDEVIVFCYLCIDLFSKWLNIRCKVKKMQLQILFLFYSHRNQPYRIRCGLEQIVDFSIILISKFGEKSPTDPYTNE